MSHAETVRLYAAGSLKAALGEAARAFESEQKGRAVETVFAASGLLRERIERGETAHVFASANMAHPRQLASQGKGGTVRLFARNQLCAIAKPGLAATPATLLDVMLAPSVRLGTSTPRADPSGDYAFELFAKAEAVKRGSRAALEKKAHQLTGGPTSKKAPAGRNQYGWVMQTGRADVFLTYCTNAVLAQKEVPELQIVEVPQALAVGADYGLIVLSGAPQAAEDLANFIAAGQGQTILRRYGFGPGASGQ